MSNILQIYQTVGQLMQSFRKGEIAVPEIQRDVVWDGDQVKELIDSIIREYPCGSLILWQPRMRDEKLLKEIIRPEWLDFFADHVPKYFLIDGQQRITALASVILERGFLKRVEPELEEELPSLFVDLKMFPKRMQTTSDGSQYHFPWVLMNSLFDGSTERMPDFDARLQAGAREKIKQTIQQIRDYQFPIQIITDRKYPEVGEIFSRVNSQGTPLTGAEIHIAAIIPHWRGAAKNFRDYRKTLRRQDYDLDLTFLMRALAVIQCNTSKIKKLADRIADQKIGKSQLNRLWVATQKGTDKVISLLRKDLLLDKNKFFTSKNALVPMVYYVAKTGSTAGGRKKLTKFFIMSQLGGHYSSASETVLNRDIKYLSEPGIKMREGFDSLLSVVVSEAKQEYRGLKIKPDAIRGSPSKNVLILLMYMAMRRKGAKDFGSGEVRSLNDIASEETQLHHIFPFDFMMKDEAALKYREDNILSISEFREQVNDVANLTFLSKTSNVSIGAKSPWQYLEDTTKDVRKAHFIPDDPSLWKPENYQKFLDERRRLLSKAINSLLHSLG
jgi:hypothetical protein